MPKVVLHLRTPFLPLPRSTSKSQKRRTPLTIRLWACRSRRTASDASCVRATATPISSERWTTTTWRTARRSCWRRTSCPRRSGRPSWGGGGCGGGAFAWRFGSGEAATASTWSRPLGPPPSRTDSPPTPAGAQEGSGGPWRPPPSGRPEWWAAARAGPSPPAVRCSCRLKRTRDSRLFSESTLWSKKFLKIVLT